MEKISDIMNCGYKTLFFSVEGKPIPQSRPKFTHYGPAYDPKRSREYKARVKKSIEEAIYIQNWHIANKDQPIRMYMVIYKPINSTDTKWHAAVAEAGLVAPLTQTGDIENIAKGIMDAGTGLIYEDDCQIYSLHCEQRYATEPRVDVTVESLFVNIGDLKEAAKNLLKRGEKK